MTAYMVLGDTRRAVDALPAGSVDLVLTSPPFLALRSYLPADHPDKHAEIGSEATPAAFVDTLLELTAGWDRVLAPHGSICVELGDTYSGSGGAGGDYNEGGLREGQNAFTGSGLRAAGGRAVRAADVAAGVTQDRKRPGPGDRDQIPGYPLAKSLCMIPELYRVALAYGINPLTGDESPAGKWRVRNVVRWVRPNPPVGALGDKFRPATSDMAIACKSGTRWFDLDAVRSEHKADPEKYTGNGYTKGNPAGDGDPVMKGNPAGAPPLDWWSISPGGYSGSHYAVFPPELLVKPIEAMCPRRVCVTCGEPSRRLTTGNESPTGDRRGSGGSADDLDLRRAGSGFTTTTTTTGWSSCGCPGTDGIRLDGFHTGTGWRPGRVLDPFGGSGTTAVVATGHGRDCILVDLDERNVHLARERVGMWLTEIDSPSLAQLLEPTAIEVVA